MYARSPHLDWGIVAPPLISKLLQPKLTHSTNSNSENERKKRILQFRLSHPDINNDQPDLSAYVIQFMETKMKMERREIDTSLVAQKSFKPQTILVTLTHIRFKKLLFAAKKKLHVNNDGISTNLYINEHLTSHNLKLLMCLKKIRRRRIEEDAPVFSTTYSFDGKNIRED